MIRGVVLVAALALASLGQPAQAQVPGAYPGPTALPGGLAPADASFGADQQPYQSGAPTAPYDFGQQPNQPTYSTPAPGGFSGQPQGMPVGQASAVLVALPATPLRLTDGPGTLDITVDGAPPFRSFELTLEYDPTAMVVTNVSPGAMMAAAGGTLQPLGPDLSTPGSLRYGVSLADATAWPEGSGGLARVTLAPLVQSGAVSVRLTSATLVDQTGQRIDAATRDGIVEIPVSPPPAAQTEAVASATALAQATPAAGPAAPPLDLGTITDRLTTGSGLLLWLAVLGLGLLLALTGWALGKRGSGHI